MRVGVLAVACVRTERRAWKVVKCIRPCLFTHGQAHMYNAGEGKEHEYIITGFTGYFLYCLNNFQFSDLFCHTLPYRFNKGGSGIKLCWENCREATRGRRV